MARGGAIVGLGAVSLAQVATLAPDALLRRLGSGPEGLTSAEEGGASRCMGRTRSAWTSFGDINVELFRGRISLLLALAGLLTVAVDSPTDGAVDPLCGAAGR
jgi:hypothetical protein